MTTVGSGLFKGVAVVIDNGIGTGEAIDHIISNISASGGHAIQLLKLPADDYDLEHFSRVSFFIMDWNLHNQDGVPLEAGVRLPGELNRAMVEENIAFLKRLRRSRHAPVFIFTNEDPEVVRDELGSDADLQASLADSHILVKSKSEVKDRLYEVLDEWARQTPSVFTLRSWERIYSRAANELFIDLHNTTPFWPVLMWQTFGADGVPPQIEMNRLINRLVESRMGPLDVDLGPYLEDVDRTFAERPDDYRQTMFRVLEGERFLRAHRLEASTFAPGDVFGVPVGDGRTTYWINIRPECDCLRGGDSHELYLLAAKTVQDIESQIDPTFGTIGGEKDNEAIVYAMMGGESFSIKLKDVRVRTLKAMRDQKYERVGRLLPPFITRVQQRYAAYVQRPGLPRIPPAMHRAPAQGPTA